MKSKGDEMSEEEKKNNANNYETLATDVFLELGEETYAQNNENDKNDCKKMEKNREVEITQIEKYDAFHDKFVSALQSLRIKEGLTQKSIEKMRRDLSGYMKKLKKEELGKSGSDEMREKDLLEDHKLIIDVLDKCVKPNIKDDTIFEKIKNYMLAYIKKGHKTKIIRVNERVIENLSEKPSKKPRN
jgi:hypothetical protein